MPDAGGDRTVDEDASNSYSGVDNSGTAATEGWEFDGNIVDGNPVSYTFDTPGVYVVSYWADDGIGSNVSDTIAVTVLDLTNPVASAGSDQSVAEDTVVNFDGSASTDNDPNFGSNGRYYWTFTDGSTARSLAGSSASYTFNTPGVYVVNLLVLDAAGNFAADSLIVTVGDVTAPSGSASVPSSINEDNSAAFASSAVTDNDPNFASNRRDYWTFTDGTARNLSGTSQSWTFNTPGTYSITLTVMDAAGNKLTTAFSLTVVDTTVPSGSGTIPSPSNEDAVVSFSSGSVTDNDPTFSSTRRDYWTFTDGVAQNLSGSSQSWTFNTPGTYSVTLTVMDATGNKLTQAFSVVIRDITVPSGSPSVPSSVNEDSSVTFDASSMVDNDPTFSSNRRIYWTFTAGSAQNLTSPPATGTSSFTFATPGSYAISLLVMDATGNRFAQAFTITVSDITAPTSVLISGGGVSVERFRSSTQTGSATDNVAVAAYWWTFTDGSAFNVSGTVLTRTWSNTGSFVVTFSARDAAFNIASTTTTITVTADITPPTVTFSSQPTSGDDITALVYTASASDLDPACAASCNWTWIRDGVITNYGVQTISVTWTPGRHFLSLLVRDPTGNTRNATITPIDIDQVVAVDTTYSSLNFSLNWNIRIQQGATLTIRNSQVWNTTLAPARTVVISVSSGRLVIEDSQITSLATTYGFRFVANGTAGAGSFIFINRSTIDGLFYDSNVPAVARAPISINDATLSITDTTLRNVRLTGSVSTPQTILGTNANIFLNNVTIEAQTVTTMGGLRFDYTSAITVLQTREIVLDRLTARTGRTAVQFTGTSGLTGTVNMTLIMNYLRTTTSTSTNRAIDIAITGNSGRFNFRFTGIDAANNNYGALFATHSSFTGVVDYNISDSNFDSAISSNAIYTQFTSSSARFNFAMSSVSAQRASQFAWQSRFETSGWNQGTIWLNNVTFSNSTSQSGWWLYHYNSRITTYIDVIDSRISNNRNQGIFLDSYQGQNSVIRFNFTRTQIADNLGRGIFYQLYYFHYNTSFNFVDSSVVRNTGDNFYYYDYASSSNSLGSWGDMWINMTRSSFSNSLNGNGLYFYTYYYANNNITGQWTDSNIDNNRQNGVYFYNYYLQYGGLPTGGIGAPISNFTLWTDRSTFNRNGVDGLQMYDYYLYGYLTYTCNPACNYLQYSAAAIYDIHLNNSQANQNSRRGVSWSSCMSYCYYSATLMDIELTGGTTVNDNSASGLYIYYNYGYSYGWLGGTSVGPDSSQILVSVVDSEIRNNGHLGSDGFGVYSYYQGYYGMGDMDVDVTRSSITNNAGTGVGINHQYNYYGSGTDGLHVSDSNISRNGLRGIESSYYYSYQLPGGLNEIVNNTTFIANNGGAYQHNYPESYGRYFTPWTIVFTNNVVDQSPTTAISRGVTYSCQGCGGYGGSEVFNFSGNRFTNIQGAAIAWGFDPPYMNSNIDVDISNNYVADVDDGINFGASGSSGTTHNWEVVDNVIERSNGNGMLLSMNNEGSGNQGTLSFERNTFNNIGGTSFTLIQSNIKLATMVIKDCIFNTQRTGMQLSGIVGMVDNATFLNTVKEDIVLSDGILDIHNTPVDPVKLKPVGNAAAFNVWFHLQVNVVWAGTGKPVIGAVVQMADSGGNTFFVGSVANASGIPDRDLWSYTKSTQGVLGRTPFRVAVTYFEIEQIESIDLFQDRVVDIELRDNVNPTVVISNPSDGYGTRDYTIQLDGSVFDSQSGFVFDINDPQLPSMYVEVSTDGQNWAVAHVKSSSAFEIQFDYTFTGLQEDVHFLYVRVHDDANNFVTRTIPVSIDRTAPIVTILTPVTSSIITNREFITISAETEVGAQIFVNGQTPPEVLTRPDFVHAYFIMELPVFEGPNTITVAAIDALNNQGEASVFALVDLQPPYLAVTAPEVDALTNSTSILVEGQTEDTGVTVTVNGQPTTIDSQGNFSATVNLALDVNRLNILATDAAGNTMLVVRDVRVDRTAPWINVQSPGANALLNSIEVDVIGIVEPGSTLIINDEVVSAPTGAFSRRILLTEGDNAIQFVAIDPAGNTGYRTVLVTVDSVDPVITVTGPANESLVAAGSAVVSGSIADDHAVMLLVNGHEIQVNTDGTFSFVAELFEGTNFISLEAVDGAGNRVTRVLMVVSDTEKPFVHPEFDGTFLDGAQVTTYESSVTVLGFAEKGSAVEVCAVPPGSSPGSPQMCNAIPLAADGSFRTFVELRAEALNTVNVTATDAAGNSETRQLQVVQSVVPAPPVQGPNVGLYLLYGLGILLLGGSFLLLYMRRGKGGGPTELSSAEGMPYGTPPPPPMEGDLGAAAPDMAPSPEMAPAPELYGDVAVTTAPEAAADPITGAPEGDVPAAPSRSRPMRRKAAGGGEAAEAGGLTAMGAEEEAVPGDTHQEEQKEG